MGPNSRGGRREPPGWRRAGPRSPGPPAPQRALRDSFPRGRGVSGGHRQCGQPWVHGEVWTREEKRGHAAFLAADSCSVRARVPPCPSVHKRRHGPEYPGPFTGWHAAVPVPSSSPRASALPRTLSGLLLTSLETGTWFLSFSFAFGKEREGGRKKGKKKRKKILKIKKEKAHVSCGQDLSPPMTGSR